MRETRSGLTVGEPVPLTIYQPITIGNGGVLVTAWTDLASYDVSSGHLFLTKAARTGVLEPTAALNGQRTPPALWDGELLQLSCFCYCKAPNL
jgi:hypothetical protein